MFQNFAFRLTLPKDYLLSRFCREYLRTLPLRCSSKDSCGDKVSECKIPKENRKPSCQSDRKPKKCKKPTAPYPSFSECTKDPNASKSPSECDCLKIPSQCDVLKHDKKK